MTVTSGKDAEEALTETPEPAGVTPSGKKMMPASSPPNVDVRFKVNSREFSIEEQRPFGARSYGEEDRGGRDRDRSHRDSFEGESSIGAGLYQPGAGIVDKLAEAGIDAPRAQNDLGSQCRFTLIVQHDSGDLAETRKAERHAVDVFIPPDLGRPGSDVATQNRLEEGAGNGNFVENRDTGRIGEGLDAGARTALQPKDRLAGQGHA